MFYRNATQVDKAPHAVAIRFWTNPFSIDEVRTQEGKVFRLYNLPYYYVGQIDKLVAL